MESKFIASKALIVLLVKYHVLSTARSSKSLYPSEKSSTKFSNVA